MEKNFITLLTSRIDKTPYELSNLDIFMYSLFYLSLAIFIIFFIVKIINHRKRIKAQNELNMNKKQSFLNRNIK